MLVYILVLSLFLIMLFLTVGHINRTERMTTKIEPEITGVTKYTERVYNKITKELNFDDRLDYEFATYGLIAKMNNEKFKFLQNPKSPPTVNPALWRISNLFSVPGLYKVHDKIYQLRNLDLANMTIILSNRGCIVIDTLTCPTISKLGFELFEKYLGKHRIVAIIYTHCHADHFGGSKGLSNKMDKNDPNSLVIAPDKFLEHAISENLYLGNAMSRRSVYMYGTSLPHNEYGAITSGLGIRLATCPITLLQPNKYITKTGQKMNIDGIEIVFQLTPDTEAPAEMNMYFPQFKALCLAENAGASIHNILTPRGAEVRDITKWVKYLTEAIELFGDKTDILFTSHFWPRFGNQIILDYLGKYRDAYKYIHDQTIRYINKGYNATEIAEMIKLPESLGREWYNQGFYGSNNFNVKAIYQKYMGWYDGNPVSLHRLPKKELAEKYVKLIGSQRIYDNAKMAYENGDYRWASELLENMILTEPENNNAKILMGDILTQLGYQTENGTWRNMYLTGVQELRTGPHHSEGESNSPDMLRALSTEMIFDYLSIHLNDKLVDGLIFKFNMIVNNGDTEDIIMVVLENSVLKYSKIMANSLSRLSNLYIDKKLLLGLIEDFGRSREIIIKFINEGKVKVVGDKNGVINFFGFFDNPNKDFPIMGPIY